MFHQTIHHNIDVSANLTKHYSIENLQAPLRSEILHNIIAQFHKYLLNEIFVVVLENFIVAGNTFVEPSIVVDNLKTTTRQLYCLGQLYFVFKRFCRAENIFEKLFAQYKMFCNRIPSKSVILVKYR